MSNSGAVVYLVKLFTSDKVIRILPLFSFLQRNETAFHLRKRVVLFSLSLLLRVLICTSEVKRYLCERKILLLVLLTFHVVQELFRSFQTDQIVVFVAGHAVIRISRSVERLVMKGLELDVWEALGARRILEARKRKGAVKMLETVARCLKILPARTVAFLVRLGHVLLKFLCCAENLLGTKLATCFPC